MRNNDECMLGGVMEEKRGTVRAVHLAGGRSPGRVRSSARACSSRGRSRWLRCSAHGACLCASCPQAPSKRMRVDDCQNEECRRPRAGFLPSAPHAPETITKDNYTKYPPSAKLNCREWTSKRRSCCGRYNADEHSDPAIWYYQFTGESERALGLRSGLGLGGVVVVSVVACESESGE